MNVEDRRPRLSSDPKSLLEHFLHLFDGRLAPSFLRGLLILAATGGGDLADQAEVAALELARRELLRRQCGAAAAFLAASGRTTRRATRTSRRTAGRTTASAACLCAACRRRSAGRGLHVLSAARASRSAAAAAPGGSGAADSSGIRTAGSAAQCIEALFEAADLAIDFTEVAIDLARRNAALGHQALQNVIGLSGREGRCCLRSWSWHVFPPRSQ